MQECPYLLFSDLSLEKCAARDGAICADASQAFQITDVSNAAGGLQLYGRITADKFRIEINIRPGHRAIPANVCAQNMPEADSLKIIDTLP